MVGSQDQGLYHCPTCRQDLGTTTALFLHLQTGGGRCLLARGQTLEQFKGEFRRRQNLHYGRSNARQKPEGQSWLGYHMLKCALWF